MLDGLIVCSDRKIFDELTLYLSTDLTVFEHAASVETALELANIQTFDYIFAVEKTIDELDSILSSLHEIESYRDLPVLCAHSASNYESREILWEKGVRDILYFPISREELKLSLEKFLLDFSIVDSDERSVGMQGKLEDYSLIDIVQTLEQNTKTGMLTLYHGRDEGRIWFKNGEIYDAKVSRIENIEAILKMCAWSAGDFAISFVEEDYERKIFVENRQILLDAMQHMDLRNKLLNTLPPKDETLLISPETDIYKVKEEDLNYLRFFQGGQNITGFLSAFDDNEIVLLEKVKEFIANKILMTREEFDSHTTEAERELTETGLKNMFKKLFRGKPVSGTGMTGIKRKEKIAGTDDDLEGERELYAPRDFLFQTKGLKPEHLVQLIKKI